MSKAIQVEWFNVTYKTVVVALVLLVLAGGGVVGAWYYLSQFSPQEEAAGAIRRAERRLGQAQALATEDRGPLDELVDSAKVALDEARSRLSAGSFDDARFAAIRSENLSLKAISMAEGDEGEAQLVRFYRIEGDVRVKRAGEFSWRAANPDVALKIGDQVKTSSSASAKLIYFDGTVTTIQPGSLLEIRNLYEDPVTKVRRVKEKLRFGEVKASTQERNVSGSYHEVATDKVAARSESPGEFRVAFDREQKTAVIDVFDGQIQVATKDKKESLNAGERVRAKADGRLTAKETLPAVPRLLSPSDERVFIYEDPLSEKLTLNWEAVPSIKRYRLMISDKSLFTNRLYDAERDSASAVIDGIPAGSYYWKVAAVNSGGVMGQFSGARRFRVSSQRIRDRTDTEPPVLEITEFVSVGQMVIINGLTEPGASLWVQNDKVEVYDDGTFYTVVRLRREGLNKLALVAQDNAGNETTVNRQAFVETF